MERRAIALAEPAEGFADQALLEGGEDGLDDGGFEEARGLPVAHGGLAEGWRRAHLAGDRHDDEIGTLGVVARATHDDSGPLLALTLIGEGKRDEDDIAEVIGGHTRRRPRCPRPWRKPVLMPARRRA